MKKTTNPNEIFFNDSAIFVSDVDRKVRILETLFPESEYKGRISREVTGKELKVVSSLAILILIDTIFRNYEEAAQNLLKK